MDIHSLLSQGIRLKNMYDIIENKIKKYIPKKISTQIKIHFISLNNCILFQNFDAFHKIFIFDDQTNF
jgi:hypothetical protein